MPRKKPKNQVPPKDSRPNTALKFLGGELRAWLASGLFGIALTAGLFYFTSPPTSSAEVRKRLTSLARIRLEEQLSTKVSKISFDNVAAESLDLSVSTSFVVYGTAETTKGMINRFLVVYEPKSQSLIDKIAGRPGFYDIAFWAIVKEVGADGILATKMNVEDIDHDGNKDIFLFVRTKYADSSSKGLLVLKKDKNEVWRLMGLPSLTQRMHEFASGKLKRAAGTQPATQPGIWFANINSDGPGDKVQMLKDYAKWDIDEESWLAKSSTGNVTFWTVRNGTKLKIFDHGYGGYKHVGIAANVVDEEAVLSPHHVMVNFFKIENDRLVPDPLWNWGYPMLSDGVDDIVQVKLKDFQKVGVSAHVAGRATFSATDFELAEDEDE